MTDSSSSSGQAEVGYAPRAEPPSLEDYKNYKPIPQPDLPRQALLKEALKITSHDRNSAYGAPEDNFKNIAAYWNEYFYQSRGKIAVHLSRQDVAHMMILMKMARLGPNPNHRDSLVDIAGYAACAEDCRVANSRPSSPVAAQQNRNLEATNQTAGNPTYK